jgi:hypothetical protein
MSGFGFGKGPPLTAEHQAVHEIRADETLVLRARIAELEAEVADLNDCLTLAHMDGFEKGRDAARAALEKK